MKLILITLLFVICTNKSDACFKPWTKPPVLNGTVQVYRVDERKLTVHSYTGQSKIVNSFIIELKSELIIYDVQLLLPEAKELLLYAQSLGKLITRIYISHQHGDHEFGAEVFKSIAPIYALQGTIDGIKKNGQSSLDRVKLMFKDLVTNNLLIPNKIQNEGFELIDGVRFNFRQVLNAETDYNLNLILPDYNIMFAGDYVFGRTHLNLQELRMDSWIASLNDYKNTYQFRKIFVGHGDPGDNILIQENIDYLQYAKLVLSTANDFDYFKFKLTQKFPNFKKPEIIDFLKPTFPIRLTIPNSIQLDGNNCYPVGVTVWNGIVYASCFASGEIQVYNLATQKLSKFLTNSSGILNSTFGIRIDPNRDWLFSCHNPQFNVLTSKLSELRAYNLFDGSLVKSWELLNGSFCKSITLDDQGNAYVADARNPRIIKVNTNTNIVSEWKNSDMWKPVNSIGISQLNFINSSIFTYSGNSFFQRVDLNSDRSDGQIKQIPIKNSDNSDFKLIGIDGIAATQNNNEFLFAFNDVTLPGAQGVIYKINLDSSGLVGTSTAVVTNLKEPSGVAFYNAYNYAFVSISQLGYLFGFDAGAPSLPFTIFIKNFN